MAEHTSIQWCDHTFNPVRGCTKVSAECANCYAARDAVRFPGIRGKWGDSGTRIVAIPSAWKGPVRWNKRAALHHALQLGRVERPRVFCASLGDIFEDWQGELRFPAAIEAKGYLVAQWDGFELVRDFPGKLPLATMDHLRLDLFRLIQATPNLDWLLLTKRPENVVTMVERAIRILEGEPAWDTLVNSHPSVVLRNWLADWMIGKPPENIWLGTTAGNQEMADLRIPQLLKIPAKVRFLSMEPLLGPVDLTNFQPFLSNSRPGKLSGLENIMGGHIHWVITGGESGPHARPMHPDWARSVRDQCVAAKVPFFFKQWGEWCPASEEFGVTGSVMPATGEKFRWIGWDGKTQNPSARGLADPIMAIARQGKVRAGRLLDGREWNEVPCEGAKPQAGEPAETEI